jgi:hypothetical protein
MTLRINVIMNYSYIRQYKRYIYFFMNNYAEFESSSEKLTGFVLEKFRVTKVESLTECS